jgi:hypothetical protein
LQHAIGVALRIVRFELVDDLIHVDDRLAHPRDQQFGQLSNCRADVKWP